MLNFKNRRPCSFTPPFSYSLPLMLALMLSLLLSARGEDATVKTNAAWRFPCNPEEIAHYTAYRVSQPMKIDGELREPGWQAAPRSPRFIDILTGKQAMYDTRAALLWD